MHPNHCGSGSSAPPTCSPPDFAPVPGLVFRLFGFNGKILAFMVSYKRQRMFRAANVRHMLRGGFQHNMKCRYCLNSESKVVDSRPTEDGTAIRRRRECTNCGKRFTTYEKIEEIPITVVKRDGVREPFNSEKILAGVRKACEKRPVSAVDQNKLVDDVIRELFNSLETEVTTIQIGELVMQRLKQLDEVAYVRFASVYRQFKDINTFMEELKSMLREK